jgi:DNA (cytosine-5)-methyltransferase 1|tara:strand:- start:2199 stop:3197 length:999 start_codon:yes stop_codon:yes gene_type:complete
MCKLSYVDLFCGAGGFSLGLDKRGFKNIFSVDINPSFCETYRFNFNNHKLIQDDISKISSSQIKSFTKNKKVNVVVGGPPCQGFSIAGNIGRKFIDDPRNFLFKEFIRIVKIINPDFIVMENVARLYNHNKGKTRTEIIESFKKIKYQVECEVLNSSHFGVPQSRRRIFFIGTKNKKSKIIFPKKDNLKPISIKKAISRFPILKSGESSDIPNHIAMNHTDQMLKKMSYLTDGGNRNEIPKDLRPKSGDARKYIRYNSKQPSFTVTGDMRKIFHYNQNRALTVRELAAIQSFPDNFIFKGNRISQQLQVGNAVPPKLAEAIADTIIEMTNNE